jgi:hypothetical protein
MQYDSTHGRLHLKNRKRLIEAIAMNSLRAIILFASGCILLSVRPTGSYAQPHPLSPSPAPTIAFISDPQTPLFIESLFVGMDRNEEAADSLFASIQRLHPAALCMLGDLVSFGAYSGAWEKMDGYIQGVRKAGIPVHAILGNHELMVYSGTGERFFEENFPDHRKTGYCVTIDSVAVVLLNSNFSKLAQDELIEQQRWYLYALDSLRNTASIAAIVVCCHHSPFTNSRIVEADEEVRQQFVPPFIANPKCRLFLSGHAHTSERFRYQGKDFVVLGGGGGARHSLFTGTERRWNDISPGKKPLFHYVTLVRRNSSLLLTVQALADDFRRVEPGYSFGTGDE